ncbi:phosphatidylinositol 4,5-bisphosphate 5-phosphatase A-like isoform X1 [Teleopsis dalmanni]|uniref:phosphatidylinositol 4,5-bisphosphate 5-phosphatase A-like isoform X1 n=1 Tax=Teleopsis dalmanni TaxID=139649 RepID=UPI0018CE1C7D|nr:phosphatidylinositol 4,5-bisphosphate 5-phosphatase A-like isoform X1 [Teleopsis dalmanni]XP_037956107.1 phosphatidylinositol 4,5-bisphosphate 5-phosphatase A-like isoform X1 [Teleopsis dalmanni]
MVAAKAIADLCIYILTWNVGTNSPNNLSLTDALSLNGTSNCPDQQIPDIYVIALQEVNTKPKNQLLNYFQDDPWVFKIREHFNDKQFAKVSTEQLQGILIMMFSQIQHIPHIKDIEVGSTKTGFGGLWGNKGAVSIRMSLYGTGVAFVGAHLAAHDKKLKERIEDYNQIINNHHYDTNKYKTIFDHDFVFWFGDLNFRIDGTDSAWDIRTLVEARQFAELLERDQLNLVRKTGNAFGRLEEHTIDFAPTFKFIEGTSDYDLNRRPAWCDRILYRVQADKYPSIKLSLDQLSYKSHPEYTLSDHKPVSAEFLYKIETETHTDEDLHILTHSDGNTETPLASVIILTTAFLYAFI